MNKTHEIVDPSNINQSISGVAKSLSQSLDDNQKESVLNLLKSILHMDDDAHELEHALYRIFEDNFKGE